MTIAFIHPHKAFLPEIDAYIDFFSKYQINCVSARPEDIGKIDAQVHWHFMGMDRSEKQKGILKIHEYASASLPPFRKQKDFLKKHFCTKPDFRLFLNEYVQEQLGFHDKIPFGFRDMGIDPVEQRVQEPVYDFIYCGSVSKDMHFDKLLSFFIQSAFKKKTLLVLTKEYESFAEKYKACPNIIFKGPVPQKEVAGHIRSARFAINYKPDLEPHSHQTSTKLLEYAACKVPIITSDFYWMREFEKKFGGSYFYLQKDFSNFSWEEISNHTYSFPDLQNWSWERQIRNSGVLDLLKSKFGQLGNSEW